MYVPLFEAPPCVLCVLKVERRCLEGQDGGGHTAEWHSLALTCPRTCRLCDDSSPASCQLPTSWRGSWTDATTGRLVTVNETAMDIAADEEDSDRVDRLAMGCVRWRGGSDDSVMLVTVFGAGCRPRYRCARVLRQSPALVYLQLSDASSWPLVESPSDQVDCRSFRFDRWRSASPASRWARTTDGFLLPLVADGSRGVECQLPNGVAGVENEARFRAGNRCRATLFDSDGVLRLAVSGCGETVQRQFGDSIYRCLESSTGTDPNKRVIVTTSVGGERPSLFCWLFSAVSRRGRSRQSSSTFYLLTGDECHSAVVPRSPSSFRPTRQLVYTAAFTPQLAPSTTESPPRTQTSQFTAVTYPRTSGPATVSTKPEAPKPRNVTMVDADEEGQSGGFEDAFVVTIVAIIMAVIQLILLCGC